MRNTIVLNESGFDTGMSFEKYCELAAEHGDNPSDYSTDIEDFVFVSKKYAEQDPYWEAYDEWPDDLPLWEYRPFN